MKSYETDGMGCTGYECSNPAPFKVGKELDTVCPECVKKARKNDLERSKLRREQDEEDQIMWNFFIRLNNCVGYNR